MLVHFAFQIMVAFGFILIGLSLWFWRATRRGSAAENKWLLRALVYGSPLGILALEAGWIVTEVGRQPWVIYRVMRTSAAVTPASHVQVTFAAFTILYLFLGIVMVIFLRRLAAVDSESAQPPTQEVAHAG
jgi:cytochrome d ubiquinol oxidase subunit I